MALPPAGPELGRRLLQIHLAYVRHRMGVIAARPGNPFGIETREHGHVGALMARGIPIRYFNTVFGLRGGDEALVAELDAWYRAGEVRGSFGVLPGDLTPALSQALAHHGYVQTEFDPVLYGEPHAAPPPEPPITIEPVTDAVAMESFLDVHLAGWGVAEEFRGAVRDNMRGWLAVPDWRLFLARWDGVPAATGKLFLHDGIGFLADAATLPAFRGRGLQSALLRHRAAEAAAAGAELLYSHAAFGSSSQRNMERIGMRLLLMRGIWQRP